MKGSAVVVGMRVQVVIDSARAYGAYGKVGVVARTRKMHPPFGILLDGMDEVWYFGPRELEPETAETVYPEQKVNLEKAWCSTCGRFLRQGEFIETKRRAKRTIHSRSHQMLMVVICANEKKCLGYFMHYGRMVPKLVSEDIIELRKVFGSPSDKQYGARQEIRVRPL